MWYQDPLSFDHQKALEDFNPNYLNAEAAIHQSIDYYQETYGEHWPEGTYGWTLQQERAFIHQKLK